VVELLRVLRIQWRARRPFGIGSECIIGSGPEEVQFEHEIAKSESLAGMEVSVRSVGAADRVADLMHRFDPSGGYVACLAGGKTTCVLFELSKGPWQVGWELLLERLPNEVSRRAFVPARTTRKMLGAAASRSIDSLKIVILVGYAGDPPNIIFPQREADGVIASWGLLDSSVQARIAQPVVLPFNPSTLSADLARHQPHVVWYCGHGRSSPRPGLMYARDEWLSVDDFSRSIPTTSPPLACVFWACDLGASSSVRTAPAPDLQRVLTERGVSTMVAMQSPIVDRVARALALEFFQNLAMGDSFERAVAGARRVARMIPQQYADWASPAVWLSRAPQEELQWASAPASALQSRMLARISVRLTQKAPDLADVDERDCAQAAEWAASGRVIVQADVTAEATMIALDRVSRGLTQTSGYFPLFIRFVPDMRTADVLVDWAKELLAWVDEDDRTQDLGRVVDLIERDPIQGLRELPNHVMIVLIGPSAEQIDDLLFELERKSQICIVLVVPEGVAVPEVGRWTLDRLRDGGMNTVSGDSSGEDAALFALAVLDMPMPESRLRELGFSRERASRLLFETNVGPLLAASERRLVLQRATSEQIQEAHRRCLALFDTERQGDERLARERLRHLVGADDVGGALVQAGWLVETLSGDGRPVAITQVFEQLTPLKSNRYDLRSDQLLLIARAFAQLGLTRRTESLLLRITPADPLEKAVWYSLKSEVAKSSGTAGWRERAFAAIEQAIQLCETEARGEDETRKRAAIVDLPDYQLTRARLEQYLSYEFAKAAEAYRDIIRRWGADTNHRLTVATACRNLAECIVSLEGDDAATLQEAEAELQRAKGLLNAHPKEPLNAQISYERIKLAELRGEDSRSVGLLIRKCIEESRNLGFGMLTVIATARLFWNDGTFESSAWSELERVLYSYRWHGWAQRTMVNGRLRAARALEKSGDLRAAAEQLERNLEELLARPGFDRGTDRDRMAYTLGGLFSLSTASDARDRYLDLSRRQAWMIEWLGGKAFTSIEAAWKAYSHGNR
jgi:hypothetical protein